jgi:hypothetical protein
MRAMGAAASPMPGMSKVMIETKRDTRSCRLRARRMIDNPDP